MICLLGRSENIFLPYPPPLAHSPVPIALSIQWIRPLILFQKAVVFKIEKPFAQIISVRGPSLWFPRKKDLNWELMNYGTKEIYDRPHTHAGRAPQTWTKLVYGMPRCWVLGLGPLHRIQWFIAPSNSWYVYRKAQLCGLGELDDSPSNVGYPYEIGCLSHVHKKVTVKNSKSLTRDKVQFQSIQ